METKVTTEEYSLALFNDDYGREHKQVCCNLNRILRRW